HQLSAHSRQFNGRPHIPVWSALLVMRFDTNWVLNSHRYRVSDARTIPLTRSSRRSHPAFQERIPFNLLHWVSSNDSAKFYLGLETGAHPTVIRFYVIADMEQPVLTVKEQVMPKDQNQLPIELSIVVPTFNEKDNVEKLIERIEQVLPDRKWELIFVDDDSPH